MKKNIFIILALFIFILSSCCHIDTSYGYISPEDLKTKMENLEKITIIDVQDSREWDKSHIITSIPTYSYPLKTEEDRSRLKNIILDFNIDSSRELIIVGTKGDLEEKRAYDFLLSEGFDFQEIYILKGGMKNWPYKELLD